MTIGLTYTGTDEKQQNYIRWLAAADPSLHMVTLSPETANNNGDFADCDALVLTGGIDTHPGYYNSSQLVYPNRPAQFNEKRDAFETALYRQAIQRKLPVLGICRGLQLINCLCGGTLQQDLGARNSIHKAIVSEEKIQFDKAHGLHIRKASLLEQVAGTTRAVVNSAHHQGIAILGSGLEATSFSDDELIESFEWKEKGRLPFMLSIQWHPERMFQLGLQHSPLSAGIRDTFLAAVKNK